MKFSLIESGKMGRFRRYEIIEHSPSFFLKETAIFTPRRSLLLNPNFSSFPILEDELDCTLDLLPLAPMPSSLFDDFDAITDLIQIDETPFHIRTTRRVGLGEFYLQVLSDRVSALESGFDRLLKEERKKKIGDRKYAWTAEIKSEEKDRKYKWEAEKKGQEKTYKWTAEIKRKGADHSPIEHTYTIKVSSGGKSEETKKKNKCEKGREKDNAPRIVEIEEPSDNGGIVLRQVFAKRADKKRGKRKELSRQEAVVLIQQSFRAYLIRRSQALRAIRELAIAKNKLKEIRALFNNFSYRRRLARDAEERQKFSERIIVLLLTVDAIEGADMIVRAAKKSMVDELEAMLDVVDPQPAGKFLSIRRRTFDMPDGAINKELAAGVAQVVRMLDEESETS